MKPQWFHINDIPYNKMLPDAKEWLPFLLQGRKFNVTVLLKDGDKFTYNIIFNDDK